MRRLIGRIISWLPTTLELQERYIRLELERCEVKRLLWQYRLANIKQRQTDQFLEEELRRFEEEDAEPHFDELSSYEFEPERDQADSPAPAIPEQTQPARGREMRISEAIDNGIYYALVQEGMTVTEEATDLEYPIYTIAACTFDGRVGQIWIRSSHAEALKVASWLMNNDERCYNYLDASNKTFH